MFAATSGSALQSRADHVYPAEQNLRTPLIGSCLICLLNNQHKQLKFSWSVHTRVPLASGKKHDAVGGKPRNQERTGNTSRSKDNLTVMHTVQITQLRGHQSSQFSSPKTMNVCPACTLSTYLNATSLPCPASDTHAYEKQALYLISGKAKENIILISLHKCSVPSELLQWIAERKGALAMENTGIWMGWTFTTWINSHPKIFLLS